MKTVKIYYTRKNISGYSYYFSRKIMKYNYDENGNFTGKDYIDPELKYYQLVGKHQLDTTDNDEVFRWVLINYNIGNIPVQLTEKIKKQELDASHGCFSAGDIIQIDGTCFISNGVNFQKCSTCCLPERKRSGGT